MKAKQAIELLQRLDPDEEVRLVIGQEPMTQPSPTVWPVPWEQYYSWPTTQPWPYKITCK
jgi:hypothetical protein